MPHRSIIALGVSLIALATAGQAATVDPMQFQELQWRSVGPFRGGRVLAVAGDPKDARRFYFGAVNGGVWRTDDAGRTWQPIFDDVNIGSIGAIAVAPSSPSILYVGTGEGKDAVSAGSRASRSAGLNSFIGVLPSGVPSPGARPDRCLRQPKA